MSFSLSNHKSSSDEMADKMADFCADRSIIIIFKRLWDAKIEIFLNGAICHAPYASQHDIANNKHNKVWWLVGAGFFIGATLLIGIWILTGWGIISDTTNPMMNLVGRLSLIPFTVLAALFCANQYVKQKTLIEDYAYKTVLAKSIVAFSEELRAKEPERYAEYLSTVLREIHQDPLRKRSKEKDDVSLKDTTGLLNKIVELVKESTKQ